MRGDCCGTKYDVMVRYTEPNNDTFGTHHELNSGKGTTTFYFRFMAGYHNVSLLGLD